jgi:hypothetical protein
LAKSSIFSIEYKESNFLALGTLIFPRSSDSNISVRSNTISNYCAVKNLIRVQD